MLILVVGVELGLACLFQPILTRSRGDRLLAVLVLVVSILLCPRLIPADHRFTRFLATILAIALGVKLFDLHLGVDRGDRTEFRSTFAFLINLTSAVHRKLHLEPRPGWRADLRRLVMMLLASIPGLVLFFGCFRLDWRSVPFFVEHAVKVLLFFLLLVPAAGAGAATWRLLGGRTREPMDNPFASVTPADFWRRYNRAAQQFFQENVYRPLGGPRHPVLGTLATFLVSGLIHEVLFVVSIGKLQGYQTAFFLIQGLAVALTMKLRPKGWGRVLGIAATLAFNLATSTLFFASIDETIPFYARR